MTSSKIALGSIFVLGIVFGLLLSNIFTVNVAMAATVYETNGANSVNIIDFPNIPNGGGATGTPNYVFDYRIPAGLTFDRVQFHVPDTQYEYDRSSFVFTIGNFSIPSWNCINDNCSSFQQIYAVFLPNSTKINDNTLQFLNVNGSTTVNNRDVQFIFDPNMPIEDFAFFGTQQAESIARNGFNYGRSYTVPAFRLCSGACDTDTFSNEYVPIVNPLNSLISITSPDYGETLATTSVDVSVFYVYDGSVGTTTRADISVYNAVTNELEHNSFVLVPAYSDPLNFTLPVNFTMSTGSKNIVARYVTAIGNVDIITQKTLFFNVINNSYLAATGLETPISDPYELTQIDCDTFDVGCQFQKALVFLFVPSQNILDRFTGIWQELKTLKPFGYVILTIDQLRGISSTGVGAYTLPTIPFIDAVFSPLRDGIAILLWGIFAFVFYNKRLKTLDI